MLKFTFGKVRQSLILKSTRAFSVADMTTAHNFKIDDYWLDHENRRLQIVYQESGIPRTARYPYIWLQDNCQSPERFHTVLHYRKSHVQALNLELKPEVVKVVDNDAPRFEIKWEDEHISQFSIKYLHERRFPDDVTQPCESIFSHQLKELGEIRTWGSEMVSNIKYFDFHELMEDNQTLMRWMESLYCDGLTIIKNAPSVEKGYDWEKVPLRVLSKRISFLRKVNFGEVWEVFNKPDAQNVAYTNGQLDLHTDIPAYKNAPEIQLLHCIQQASIGGRNHMVDGFKVAEHVKTEYPAVFDILVNTPIDFREYGHDTAVGYYDLESMHNTLQIDPVTKKIEKVIYSQHQRTSPMDVPLEKVEDVYRALMKWDALLNDERFMIKILLENGDIMCFNNLRVLHGREEYVVKGDGERWLNGCYLEWDEVKSRYRSLRNVYGQDWNDVR